MLPIQVQYWEYVEQKRHNLASEQANFMQAVSAMRQAGAAERQAGAAEFNAETNRLNWDVNKQNSMINARNAEINAKNAETNARNAAVNERNAAVNERQATVKEGELELDRQKFPYYVMDTQSSRMIAEAQKMNASTNSYTSKWQRQQGEESLGIQQFNANTNRTLGEANARANLQNAYTNAYNAQINAYLTEGRVIEQRINNTYLHAQNIADIANKTSQTTYNYARSIESAMKAATQVPTAVVNMISTMAKGYSKII